MIEKPYKITVSFLKKICRDSIRKVIKYYKDVISKTLNPKGSVRANQKSITPKFKLHSYYSSFG